MQTQYIGALREQFIIT